MQPNTKPNKKPWESFESLSTRWKLAYVVIIGLIIGILAFIIITYQKLHPSTGTQITPRVTVTAGVIELPRTGNSTTLTPTLTLKVTATVTFTPTLTITPTITTTPVRTVTPTVARTTTLIPTPTVTPTPTQTLTPTRLFYYVSPGGDNTKDGSYNHPWQTIQKASAIARAGDTVYLRVGTYREALIPQNSGLSGYPITFTHFPGEEAIITQAGNSVDLSGRSYITIDGLKITRGRHWVVMDSASTHNNIINNYFQEAIGWSGIYMSGSSWNTISGNTMIGLRTQDNDLTDKDVDGPPDSIECLDCNYNLIENNYIKYAPHAGIEIQSPTFGQVSSKNVIRNNIVDNPWHTTLSIWQASGDNLIEGNTLLNAGSDHQNMPVPPGDEKDRISDVHNGLQLGSSNCIIRQNVMISTGNAIALQSVIRSPDEQSILSFNNHIYNNSLYHNHIGISSNAGGPFLGNVIKNNIFYQSHDYEMYIVNTATPNDNYYINNNIFNTIITPDPTKPIYYYAEGRYTGGNRLMSLYHLQYELIPNLWYQNISVDPKFVALNEDQSDLHLQPNSPMIDAGTSLTMTTQAGSGYNLSVADAGYFSDGFGVVAADWIKVGNNQPVQIDSIDHNTNIIRLKGSITWADQDVVNLYRNSSGTVVLYGINPDIGAYESSLLTVNINQAINQADPTDNSPVNFTVVFSEPVTNFTAEDVTFSGTALPTTAIVTGRGTTYNVAISGMTASIPADVVTDSDNISNNASTSIDNLVTYNILYIATEKPQILADPLYNQPLTID